jgi:hypothetical protein
VRNSHLSILAYVFMALVVGPILGFLIWLDPSSADSLFVCIGIGIVSAVVTLWLMNTTMARGDADRHATMMVETQGRCMRGEGCVHCNPK